MTELELMDIFRDNLISRMEDANMSQQDLSIASGISKGAISKYLSTNPNVQVMPGIFSILKIANALDCEVHELIDYRDMM